MGFLLALMTFVALFLPTVASTNTTKYEIGPGRIMRDYALGTGSGAQPVTAHKPSSTVWYVVDLPLLADAAGTGSSSVRTTSPNGQQGTKYPSICIPNPLRKLGTGTGSSAFNTGSGLILQAIFKSIKNPAALGGDIGFVHSCTGGTGSEIFNNLPTSTGAVALYLPTSSGSQRLWGGMDFLKLGIPGNPTSSYRATLSVLVTNASADH